MRCDNWGGSSNWVELMQLVGIAMFLCETAVRVWFAAWIWMPPHFSQNSAESLLKKELTVKRFCFSFSGSRYAT